MLRPSSLRIQRFLSACRHGISLNAESTFPLLPLGRRNSAQFHTFCYPPSMISPIQFMSWRYLRQYTAETEKEEINANKETEKISSSSGAQTEKEIKENNSVKSEKDPKESEPVELMLAKYLRKYAGETDAEDKVLSEEELKERELLEEKIAEFLKKYSGEEGFQLNMENGEPVIRFEDYEPELKIYEDPFLDREPPPEPSEETKKEVAELVEMLRQLMDQMPDQKSHKNSGKRGNREARAQKKKDPAAN